MSSNKVLAIIPARGGSKGLPGKNIRPLHGQPLIGWTIRACIESGCVDDIIVSTDDEQIMKVATDFNVTVLPRSPHLSGDSSLVMDAVKDVLSRLDSSPEIVILLQPTSPLRSAMDIRDCIAQLRADAQLDSIASYVEAALNPWQAWKISDQTPTPFLTDANPWLPRQELPLAFQLNGAVYAFRAKSLPSTGASFVFGRTRAFIMPVERSLDIDTEIDFMMAEHLMKRLHKS